MQNPSSPRILLASASRYRQGLLDRFLNDYETVTPGVDESARPGEDAVELAARLARSKAEAVSSTNRDALIIGAEKLSCFLDWEDRATCVLFGDGAGAVVLSGEAPLTSRRPRGILATYLSADGRLAKHLHADGGPSSTGTVGKVRMNGKEVFRNAVEQISNAVFEVTERAKVGRHEIDWFVPHQANIRIIESCGKKLELNESKVIVTIDKHANTSSVSIPLALDAGIRDGRIQRKQLLVFAALGGGLAWGSALVRY